VYRETPLGVGAGPSERALRGVPDHLPGQWPAPARQGEPPALAKPGIAHRHSSERTAPRAGRLPAKCKRMDYQTMTKLRELRKEKGLSMEEAASLFGVSLPQYRKLEQGFGDWAVQEKAYQGLLRVPGKQ
jgi:DNA-binding XRE family transcriptional regulator